VYGYDRRAGKSFVGELTTVIQSPIVSIITSCYRGEHYLEGFFKSVEQQTIFDRLEIVLAANESSSKELAIIHSFQRRHPDHLRPIIVNKVETIGKSLNRCLQMARGDFIFAWDVDDRVFPRTLEALLHTIREESVDGTYGNYYRVSDPDHPIEPKLYETLPFDRQEFTRECHFQVWVLFNRELLKKTGLWDEQFLALNDFDFKIRLAYFGEWAKTDIAIGYYKFQGGRNLSDMDLFWTEHTMVKLRYGAYDRINFDYVNKARKYRIERLLINDQWLDIRKVMPDYDQFIAERKPLLPIALRKYRLAQLNRWRRLQPVRDGARRLLCSMALLEPLRQAMRKR